MTVNKTLAEGGESIFTTVSKWAREHEAIDLGQGYPSMTPPEGLLDCLRDVPRRVSNHQYAPSSGYQPLKDEISTLYRKIHSLDYNPANEITITSGATEGINAALMGLLNPGDEVVVFEPVYDQYVPVARRAGADVSVVELDHETFSIPIEKLRRTVDENTSVILLNNPHNPTGRVFEKTALKAIVELARQHDVIVLSDEVYEHLHFDDAAFQPFAELEGARDRTLTFGSAGKTFNATGWKIGWALGHESLTEALRLAHQYTTYCSATPLQVALAEYMGELGMKYFVNMRDEYNRKRQKLIDGLRKGPFDPIPNEGSYFVVAKLDDTAVPADWTDIDVTRAMVQSMGVAAIPLSTFYVGEKTDGKRMFRFAFCKTDEKINEALARIQNSSLT